jgi:hypothetical protein
MPEDLKARNDEIERLYLEDGLPLREIAKKVGITYEGVRLVLQKRGSDNATAARGIRRNQRSAAEAAATERFDETVGQGIERLLHGGVHPEEISARLTALGTQVSADDVRSFAQRRHLPVPYATAPRFTTGILRLAVLAAAASTAQLPTDDKGAELIESEDLAALAEVSTSSDEVKALAVLAATAKFSEAELSVTKNEYEAWRTQWLESFPKAEPVPWPATSQTIIKRLGAGYWNDAVKNAGLAPHERGRSRGALIYKAVDEYVQAVASFLAEAEEHGRPTSFAEYDRWAAGRPVPTGASVRNTYKTWSAAKAAAVQFAGVKGSRRRSIRQLSADVLVDRFLHLADRAIREGVAAIPSEGHGAAMVLETKRIAEDLLGDMVTAFEGFRRQWIYEAIKEDPSAFVRRLSPEGEATKGEKRAWAALVEAESATSPEAVISSTSLDKLLSSFSGDLRNAGGWLAPAAQARVDRIDLDDSRRWRLIKSLRNVIEHESREGVELLKATFAELDPVADAPLIVRRAPGSPASISQWLITDLGPAPGLEPNRLSRARVGHLVAVLVRSARAMRSTEGQA